MLCVFNEDLYNANFEKEKKDTKKSSVINHARGTQSFDKNVNVA